jgi:WD40 repeat protein
MSVSPDESWLACGTSASEIIMIPLSDDSIGYQLQNAGGDITALVFNALGDHIYSATIEGAVTSWNLKSRESSSMVSDPAGITALDVSQNENLLAALTKDGRLLLLNPLAPEKQFTLDAGDKVITSLKFVPGEGRLATGDEKGIVDIWNSGTRRIEANVEGHTSSVDAIAFDRNDDRMLTADRAGTIKLWALSDLTQLPVVISEGREGIMHLAFNYDGNAFLSATGVEVTQRPAHIRCMTDNLCSLVHRNLSQAEWSAYVGRDIDYEATCPDKTFQITVKEIIGSW